MSRLTVRRQRGQTGSRGQRGLTEHRLQTNQTANEAVKVNGEVWVTVASHQDLMERVVQTEPWEDTQGRDVRGHRGQSSEGEEG